MSQPKLKIYLSVSVSNILNNQYIADLFPSEFFHVYLPQTIVPDELEHTHFPLTAYQKCLEMMEASHMSLVILDAFGRDSAWECGWYSARKDKVLIAFVQSSSLFMRDWMVKGGLDALITTNPRLYQSAQENPILSKRFLKYIESDHLLPAAIREIYEQIKPH